MKYVEMREALRDKNQMEAEDAHLKYLQDLERGALYKGLTEGLSKGEAIGDAERIKMQEDVVINSHKAGLPVEIISSITGLTSKQMIEILKRNGLI